MSKDIKNIAVKLRNEIKKQKINEDKVKFFFEDYQSNFEAHLRDELDDGIPLDSYRVEVAYYFLDSLEESQDIDITLDSLEPDIYNADLLSWLSSNLRRADYVNQILEESDIQDCFSLLRSAQYREIEEVTQAIINYIESELEQSVEVEYE